MKHLGLALILISLSACSSIERRQNIPPVDAPVSAPEKNEASYTMDEENKVSIEPETKTLPDTVINDAKPLTDNIASPTAEPIQESETVDVTLTKKSYIDEKYHAPKVETAAEVERTETTYSGKTNGVDPQKALGWLKNGNKRFLKAAFRADGQSKKDVRRLSQNEKPHAIIFSSSDSRLPPEIIFDEKLGEIYVIRNLGLQVDNSVLNSLDYAIGDLGVRLVLVMDRSYPGKGIDFSHADQTAQKLVDQSAVLKAGLDAKNVSVVSAVYDIESGKVNFGK